MSENQSTIADEPPTVVSRKLNEGEVLQLGAKVRDMVTGISGWAYSRILHLQGCDHIGIMQAGSTKEGKSKEIYSTDILNLELLLDQSDALIGSPIPTATIWCGDKVKDPISGRAGTVCNLHVSLYEGVHVGVQPEGVDEDTGRANMLFFMEMNRAQLIEKGPNHGKKIVYSEGAPEKAIGGPSTMVRQPG